MCVCVCVYIYIYICVCVCVYVCGCVCAVLRCSGNTEAKHFIAVDVSRVKYDVWQAASVSLRVSVSLSVSVIATSVRICVSRN